MFTSPKEKKIKIRSIIRYLYLKKLSPNDILVERNEIYGPIVGKTMVYKWYNKFEEGEKEVEETKRASKKRKIGDVEKEKIIKVLNSNRKLTIREISNNTGIPKSLISMILKELGIFFNRKFYI